MEEQLTPLEIANPNRAWVVKELDKLHEEWKAWAADIAKIVEQPYDANTHSHVFADGEDNMLRHKVMQAKTLTFLNNNIKGHGFIKGMDGRYIDATDMRLKDRVKHRLRDLEILRSSLEYARVPDGYWKAKGKELVDKIVDKSPEAAARIAESYLKNPSASD